MAEPTRTTRAPREETEIVALRPYEGPDALTRPIMARLLRELITMFPSSQRTPEKVEQMAEGYYKALRDRPAPDIEAAGAAAIQQCDHFPRAAELRRLADEAKRQRAKQRPRGVVLTLAERYRRWAFEDHCPVCLAEVEQRQHGIGRATPVLDGEGQPVLDAEGRPRFQRRQITAPYCDHDPEPHRAKNIPIVANWFGHGKPWFCERCESETAGYICGGCGTSHLPERTARHAEE